VRFGFVGCIATLILELEEYYRFSEGIFEWVVYDTKWIECKSE